MEKRLTKKDTALLERHKTGKDEINHYLAPVTHCDGEFNFLLSERNWLTQELNKVRN